MTRYVITPQLTDPLPLPKHPTGASSLERQEV
jgi:hypothetical protein